MALVGRSKLGVKIELALHKYDSPVIGGKWTIDLKVDRQSRGECRFAARKFFLGNTGKGWPYSETSTLTVKE